ncbi:MAG: SCO family protein [Burkholderiales bacterium]
MTAPPSLKSVWRFLALALLLGALAACNRPAQFKSTDVTGATFARDFALTDHHGKARSLVDFRGKVVVLFFGFTHCPDVCPTTLAEFAQMMKLLGNDAEQVQVLFVTVDPERDTEALLAQYVPSFHPDFLGVRGDAEATAKTAAEFKILYEKRPSEKNYTMDHSAGTYIYDQAGRLRLFASYGLGAEALASDVRDLLNDG